MDNKRKPKSLTVSDKISILVHTDAHIATCVELAPWSTLSMPTLNPIVKNHDETEKNFVQCGTFYKQQKSLQCSPLNELEPALTT
jgi:hypothetical protein